ncbi:unnamed protein product [Rhizophagus irregularis]|uniref:Uncharacterized protein n=1 Tax=Rhizophagus irregularis TaxID=588596 RepID=A0A915ZXZ8_9GLOM|nr:hypothetical protein RIR_jg1538.t1 [Rhizophagus irregularis DAOM 181602=DAOM 197198]CAB4493683.1 unnamed protein product [Rhizophagus irregularis]CAB5394647.1 unnamed protein product [Rhizophagus irregularis]
MMINRLSSLAALMYDYTVFTRIFVAIITHLDNRISKNPTAILNVSSSSLKDGSGNLFYILLHPEIV